MAFHVPERLFAEGTELAFCIAWVVFWAACHFAMAIPVGALERVISSDPQAKHGGQRQRSVYLRRLCRSQLFCLLSLVGTVVLLVRWRRLPQDPLSDFSCEHQVIFSMAFGHWAVSLLEALQGVRDPSTMLFQGFLLHHLAAAATYAALLRTHRLGCMGTLGLLFELPVPLLNRRELSRVLGQTAWSRWMSDRKSVSEHWRFTYTLFLIGRGGPLVLYVYSLLWLQDELAGLTLHEMFLYHIMSIFFGVWNYAFLAVLDVWSHTDAAAASLPEVLEDLDRLDRSELAEDLPVEPEAAALREVDVEVLASQADAGLVWLAIEGVVYDLSLWHEHPGGAEVLRQFAGKDATAEFYKVCPAAKSSIAYMSRYQVGALRLPPREYRIFEHPVEEDEMRRLLTFTIPSLAFGVIGMKVLIQEVAEAGIGLLAGLLTAVGVGALALLLPMRHLAGALGAGGTGGAGASIWRAHALAFCMVGLMVALPVAASSSWAPLGVAAPQGLELLFVALLLAELVLAPAAMMPPLLPASLCLISWYDRGLKMSHFFQEGIYIPWRCCVACACFLVLVTRLAENHRVHVLPAFALMALYAPLAVGAYVVLRQESGELRGIFAWPLRRPGVLLFASAASLLALFAVVDLAARCSSRFATRCTAFTLALLSFLCCGLSSWRWLLAMAVLLHFLELTRHHRARLDQVASAGRFAELPWHFLGAQALWDSSRVAMLGCMWRATVCNLQKVVTSIIPDELRVYACEEPVPYYGEKVAMGLAAQYVPPKARGKDRRRPNFFVCNVGQIVESCLPDMQHTMNTLVDVWGEFHDPALPGLCANVVMVFPSSDQGWAKEINLSVWESGKDAFDWYVKSKGHKKALMEHTSGVLRTFGNMLASLEPSEPIKYQDRCRRCGRMVEAAPGQPAHSACPVCGASTFRYNLF